MNTLSKKATDFFISHGGADESNRDIYEYGALVALSFALNAAVTVSFGFIFAVPAELLAFFLPFAVHRSLSGGHHAKTWWGCLITSGVSIAAVVILLKLHSHINVVVISAVLWVVSSTLTFIFAPVENPNRPLTDSEILRFRKYSRSCTLLCVALSVAFFAVRMDRFGFCVALALGVSGVAQLIGIIIKRKGCVRNEEA
jgi:accessory gene regulator B